MRQRFGTMAAIAAVFAFGLATTSANAVPQCNSKGPQCNQFAYNSKACGECKKCTAAGGVYVHKGGSGKFAGICKLKAIPRPSGPGTPAPMEMKKQK